jgi:Putative transposase
VRRHRRLKTARCDAHDRKRLEPLWCYLTRPALSDERVQYNAAGQAELKLKTPWRDGTTHPVMTPVESICRMAALVPYARRIELGYSKDTSCERQL